MYIPFTIHSLNHLQINKQHYKHIYNLYKTYTHINPCKAIYKPMAPSFNINIKLFNNFSQTCPKAVSNMCQALVSSFKGPYKAFKKALQSLIRPFSRHYNPLIGLNTILFEILKSKFEVFLQDLSILDLEFGFLAKNCVYSRLEASRIPQVGQQITKVGFDFF